MSQRIAVMNLGVLQQVGAPLDIYERPNTLFVAGFIGNPPMSFANVTLDTANMLQGAGFSLALPPELADQSRQQQTQPDLVFGIRAEDASLVRESEPSSAKAALKGKVVTVEPLGDETIYALQIGEVLVRASTAPSVRFSPDEIVDVTFNMDRIHLFDAKTQKRVI